MTFVILSPFNRILELPELIRSNILIWKLVSFILLSR